MVKLILWDIDHTLIDPYHRTRAQLQHLWAEAVRPVLVQAQEYLPQLQVELEISRVRPALLGALAEAETCCSGLSAVILEAAFGGAIAKWLPIHDEIFYAITGVDQSFQPQILEIMEEVALPQEEYYPGVLALLQALPCDHLLVTRRETLAAGHPLRDRFPAEHIFAAEQGLKSDELGRAWLLDAISAQREREGKALIPQETIMVGDMPHDILLAADLGCRCILTTYGHGNYRDRPRDYAKAIAALKAKQARLEVAGSVEELQRLLG